MTNALDSHTLQVSLSSSGSEQQSLLFQQILPPGRQALEAVIAAVEKGNKVLCTEMLLTLAWVLHV